MGYFYVPFITENANDIYPPAKITDLEATNVDFNLQQLNLTFTAPGDDLAHGKGKN